MKARNKFFIVIGSLLGVGIILTIVGFCLGGSIKYANLCFDNRKTVSTSLPDISLKDDTDIQSLKISSTATKLRIKKGEEFSLSGKNITRNEVKDGTWHVESNPSGFLHFFHLSFLSDFEENSQITITIPRNISLNKLKIDVDAIDFDGEELDCDTVDFDVNAGSIRLDSLKARKAHLELSAGEIRIKHFDISEKATVDCNMGDIRLGTEGNLSDNQCNNLSADCNMGEIRMYGLLTGDSSLDCTMGSLRTYLPGSRENYRISADTTLGSVRGIDLPDHPDSTAVTYGSISFDCTMGDIKVQYKEQ